MFKRSPCAARPRPKWIGNPSRVTWVAAYFSVALSFGAITATASSPSTTIVKIEEDWELRVGVPDANSNSPQVSIVMSPCTSLNSWHTTIEFNHRTEPYVCGGGVHLQLWNGATIADDKGWGEFKCLNKSEDFVRWTQVMEVHDGQLKVSIQNGSGETWGEFGGDELTVAAEAPVYELSGYKVDTSVAESGVSLAGHRVREMVLRRVRYTMADGSVTEDTVDRTVK